MTSNTDKFRLTALVEAVTYLVLLCLVVVKRGFHGPDLVRVMGPAASVGPGSGSAGGRRSHGDPCRGSVRG